ALPDRPGAAHERARSDPLARLTAEPALAVAHGLRPRLRAADRLRTRGLLRRESGLRGALHQLRLAVLARLGRPDGPRLARRAADLALGDAPAAVRRPAAGSRQCRACDPAGGRRPRARPGLCRAHPRALPPGRRRDDASGLRVSRRRREGTAAPAARKGLRAVRPAREGSPVKGVTWTSRTSAAPPTVAERLRILVLSG